MEIILLEHISRLGGVGDVVEVKNGFARNYLIPQKKALRATKDNKAEFEARREALLTQDNERKSEAEKQAKALEGLTVTIVRQASEDGRLYGSVAVRDVADALQAEGQVVDRRLIDLNAAIKELGLFKVTIRLHPQVPVEIRVHIARNADSPIPEELLEEFTEEKPEEAAAADAEIVASNDNEEAKETAPAEESANAAVEADMADAPDKDEPTA